MKKQNSFANKKKQLPSKPNKDIPIAVSDCYTLSSRRKKSISVQRPNGDLSQIPDYVSPSGYDPMTAYYIKTPKNSKFFHQEQSVKQKKDSLNKKMSMLKLEKQKQHSPKLPDVSPPLTQRNIIAQIKEQILSETSEVSFSTIIPKKQKSQNLNLSQSSNVSDLNSEYFPGDKKILELQARLDHIQMQKQRSSDRIQKQIKDYQMLNSKLKQNQQEKKERAQDYYYVKQNDMLTKQEKVISYRTQMVEKQQETMRQSYENLVNARNNAKETSQKIKRKITESKQELIERKKSMVDLVRSQRECAMLEKKINEYLKAQIIYEEREKKMLQKEQKQSLQAAMEQTIYQQKKEIEKMNQIQKSNRKNMSMGSLDVSEITLSSVKQLKFQTPKSIHHKLQSSPKGTSSEPKVKTHQIQERIENFRKIDTEVRNSLKMKYQIDDQKFKKFNDAKKSDLKDILKQLEDSSKPKPIQPFKKRSKLNIQENEEEEQPRQFKPLQTKAEISPGLKKSKDLRKTKVSRKLEKEKNDEQFVSFDKSIEDEPSNKNKGAFDAQQSRIARERQKMKQLEEEERQLKSTNRLFNIGRNSLGMSKTKPPLATQQNMSQNSPNHKIDRSMSSNRDLVNSGAQHYIQIIPSRKSFQKKLILKVVKSTHSHTGSDISNNVTPLMEEEIKSSVDMLNDHFAELDKKMPKVDEISSNSSSDHSSSLEREEQKLNVVNLEDHKRSVLAEETDFNSAPQKMIIPAKIQIIESPEPKASWKEIEYMPTPDFEAKHQINQKDVFQSVHLLEFQDEKIPKPIYTSPINHERPVIHFDQDDSIQEQLIVDEEELKIPEQSALVTPLSPLDPNYNSQSNNPSPNGLQRDTFSENTPAGLERGQAIVPSLDPVIDPVMEKQNSADNPQVHRLESSSEHLSDEIDERIPVMTDQEISWQENQGLPKEDIIFEYEEDYETDP